MDLNSKLRQFCHKLPTKQARLLRTVLGQNIQPVPPGGATGPQPGLQYGLTGNDGPNGPIQLPETKYKTRIEKILEILKKMRKKANN